MVYITIEAITKLGAGEVYSFKNIRIYDVQVAILPR